MTREAYNNLSLAEKIEDLWNYIAHVFAVDADDEQDVERFRNDSSSWELDRFEGFYDEYKELLAQSK